MRAARVLLLLLLAPLCDVLAQEPPPLEPNTRVRITARWLQWHQQVATFHGLRGDTLVLATDSTVLCPLTAVERLEVSAGRKSHLWVGAGIGLLAGAALGAITWPSAGCDWVSEGQCRLYGALGLGAVGAVAGGVTGLLIKSDRWEEVPLDRLRVSVRPVRDGVGLGANIAF